MMICGRCTSFPSQNQTLDACALVVERIPDKRSNGVTAGWLFYLYDNAIRNEPAPDNPASHGDQSVSVDVPEYLFRVMTEARGRATKREESEGVRFAHLKLPAQDKDNRNPFSGWPKVTEIRLKPVLYQRMCMYYLDLVRMTQWPGHDIHRIGNPFNPVRVFTMENAIERMKRMCRDSIDHEFYEVETRSPVPGILTPANPKEAIVVHHIDCLPTNMSCILRPQEPITDVNTHSNAFKDFRQRPENQRLSLEEVKEKFAYHVGNGMEGAIESTLEAFFQEFRRKMTNVPLANRIHVAREAYRQWPKVWNASMREGQAYAALHDYSVQHQRDGYINFCSSFTPLDEDVDVVGNIFAQHLKAFHILKHIASAHVLIAFIKLTGFHAAAYYPNPASSKNLIAGITMAGEAGVGKTHMFKVAMMLCIIGTVLDIAHQSNLVDVSGGNERGLAKFMDEMKMAYIGVSKVAENLTQLHQFIQGGSHGTATSDADSASRRAATSNQQVAKTVNIGKHGERDVATHILHAHGTLNGTSNIVPYELPKANFQRRFVIAPRVDQLPTFDTLDQVTEAESDLATAAAKSKNWAALQQWNYRTQYIATLCHTLMAARVLPYVNTTLHDRRYNTIAHYLKYLGLPNVRDVRPFEKTTQLAVQLTLERIITIVFDMGIGGPDPSKPWRIEDMELLVPFMFIPECVTALSLEMAPIHVDPVYVEIFRVLGKECGWTRRKNDPKARCPSEQNYYFDHTILGKYPALTQKSSEAVILEALAKELVDLGVPYQLKVVFGALSTLMRQQIPTLKEDGHTTREPAWKLVNSNELRFHYKLIDNFTDEHIIWKVFCIVAGRTNCNKDDAPMFVRGLTRYSRPEKPYKGRFYTDLAEYNNELKKADAKFEAQEKVYTEAIKFEKERKEIDDIQALILNTPDDDVERLADYQKTYETMVRTLEKKITAIKKPERKKVVNPRQVRNIHYETPHVDGDNNNSVDDTDHNKRDNDWGGLGDMDTREVTDHIDDNKRSELLPEPSNDDEINMVYGFLQSNGLVRNEHEYAMHYANPRNMARLSKAYYRYRKACCDVYDVVRRVHIHKVRQLLASNSNVVDEADAPFITQALRTTDATMRDAATDTEDEKEMMVEDRLQSKLERTMRALAQAACDRWRLYQEHGALKGGELHTRWVYADLMNNFFRKLVVERSWSDQAVNDLAGAIYQVWTQPIPTIAALHEPEFHRLATECVSSPPPPPPSVDAAPMDHDAALDRVVQRMEVQRQKRDRDAERAQKQQEARRRPRAKRMRTVDDFDAVVEQGAISDSSADEKEEEPKKKTRFDFLEKRKPIQHSSSSIMNDEEEEEEVISDNGVTRDCIVQPMIH